MLRRPSDMIMRRVLLSRQLTQNGSSPFASMKMLPARAASSEGLFDKELLPGEEKRTKIDLTRKQPEYESPYSGPDMNPNTSGFDESYDLWWDDGIQREYTYHDDTPWIKRGDVAQWTLYFLGWGIALYTFYRYFLLAPANSLHPMTEVRLTDAQREEAIRLRDERRRFMEKYEIQE